MRPIAGVAVRPTHCHIDTPLRTVRRRRFRRRLARILVVSSVVIAACASDDGAVDDTAFRVAVLPDQEASRLRSKYLPLLDFLDERAGVDAELIIPADYDALLDEFSAGRVDLAWFGGLTYLQADARSTATPLVMRDVDLEFTTDFVVSASAPGASIADFADAAFAFGPELSTSGHLMPRSHLEQRGIVPEMLFATVVHSSGHDETARWVADGTVAIAAINSVVMEQMFASGEISPDGVRILETTTPYRNYVWATSEAVGDDVRRRVLDAFLGLELTDPEHAEILGLLGAGGYVPADRDDFADLRAAANGLGLLDSGP